MKIALILSLIINVVLVVFLYLEKQKPPLERLVIEHETEVIERKIPVSVEAPPQHGGPKLESKKAMMLDPVLVEEEKDFQLTAEETEAAKKNFLEEQLHISPETLKAEKRLRQDFQSRVSQLYQKHPTGITMSFQEKHKMIQLEEEYEQDLKKLYGQKKWERYKDFVNRYNQNLIKRNQEGGESPGILMGL